MRLQLTDKGFEERPNGSGEGWYIDGLLKQNLDSCKTVIHKDWDYIFIVDGEVGSGKSLLTLQMAYYVTDGNFSLNNICFTGEQFKKAILNAPKYSAIIFDEAFRGLSARAAMTNINRSIVSMLNEIRQKNLFVFIVIPSIWDLDAYAKLHRSKGCIHVHTEEGRERGYFRFFKNTEYFKKFFSSSVNRYMYPKFDDIYGRFFEFYPIDEQLYRKKKLDALGEYAYNTEEEDASLKLMEFKKSYIVAVNKRLMECFPKSTQTVRAFVCGTSVPTLQNYNELDKINQIRGDVPIFEGQTQPKSSTHPTSIVENSADSAQLPNTSVLRNGAEEEPPKEPDHE